MQVLFHGIGFYPPDKMIGPAVWPHHDAIVVLHGSIRLQIGKRSYPLHEGDALVIPPGHHFEGGAQDGDATIWVMHFTGKQQERFPFHAARRPLPVSEAACGHFERSLLEEIAHVWGGSRPQKEELALLGELLLARMKHAAREPRQAEPSRLREAVEETLNGNLGSDVTDMAKRAGVCPSRFRQLFGKHYGMSPIKFLQRARMAEAKRLLSGTSRPIKEISRTAGYQQLAAFHRAFRKEVQMTPAAYRKRFGGVV